MVSDIHGAFGDLNRAVKEMGSIDLLLHAGDGAGEIQRLSQGLFSHQIMAVTGNCDYISTFSAELIFTVDSWKILLTHGHLYGVKHDLTRLSRRGENLGADLVVFGHTHIPLIQRNPGICLFNPGTLSAARSYGRPSYGLIEVTPEGLAPAIKYLS